MKKFVKIAISLLLILSMLAFAACGETDGGEGTGADSKDTGTSGTSDTTEKRDESDKDTETEGEDTEEVAPPTDEISREIGTPEQLIALAKAVNEDFETFEDETFILTADIDMAGYDWTAIGHGNPENFFSFEPKLCYFGGIFDGKGHTIKNLEIDIDGMGVNGLFGLLYGAEVRNLGLEATMNVTVTSINHFNGYLAGWTMDTTIENCYVKGGGLTEGSQTGQLAELGGIVGVAACYSETIINNCYFVGTVGGDMANYTVGGIVGYTPTNFTVLTVTNCYSDGAIPSVSDNYDNYGGLWSCTEPEADSTNYSATFTNCYTTASQLHGTRYTGVNLTVDGCEAGLEAGDITAEKLGDAFVEDTENINGGLPLLSWQVK